MADERDRGSSTAHRAEDQLDQLARWVFRAKVDGLGRDGASDLVARAKAAGLDVRNPKDARWLLRRARERHLVDVDVRDRAGASRGSAVDHRVAKRLKEAVDAVAPAGARSSSRADFRAYPVQVGGFDTPDDVIHEVIGRHAGAEVLPPMLHAGSRLCLASGRAVAAAMHTLMATRGLGGVKVYSLTGGASDDSTGADAVVRQIETHPERSHRPSGVKYMVLPLALPEEVMDRKNEGTRFMRRMSGYALTDWWEKQRPEVVVLGASSLTPEVLGGHHLWASRNPWVREHADGLGGLIERKRDHLRVGEVCHQFFVCDATHPEDEKRAKRHCNKINECIVGPDLPALANARQRVVVAGGVAKVPVLTALLSERSLMFPNVVVTDVETARAVTERLKERAQVLVRRRR